VKLLLDSNLLSRLCHPTIEANRPLVGWLERLLGDEQLLARVYIPEIVDYEVRRGLLHIALRSGRPTTRSVLRLDRLVDALHYLPLNTPTLRRAAGLWAQTRAAGKPTAPPEALDGDVILAAQAIEVAGTVATENVRHLSRFVPVVRWQDMPLRAEQ
jgi:predicted nucleic acid-binding protein